MDANAASDHGNLPSVGCALDFGQNFACRVQSTLATVPNGNRCAKDRHESVSEKFVHNTLVTVHDVNRETPESVQQSNGVVGCGCFGKSCKIADVEHENANFAELRVLIRRVCQQLIDHCGRDVLSKHLYNLPPFFRRTHRTHKTSTNLFGNKT